MATDTLFDLYKLGQEDARKMRTPMWRTIEYRGQAPLTENECAYRDGYMGYPLTLRPK